MNRSFNRLLNLHPDEGPKVLILLVMFFLFITGTTWAETLIESSYYYLAGVSSLGLVFTLHAIFSIVATAGYTAFVDRTSNRKLLVAVCGIAMLIIGVGLLLLGINQILGYTILYVLVRAVRTSFLIHWWNYVSDFVDTRSAKRIVPVITSASRVAIIFAGLTIPLLNRFLSPVAIILLWVATFLIIALMSWEMRLITRKNAGTTSAIKNPARLKKERGSYIHNIREGFQYVSSSNYLRWIALSTFLMVVIFALLNYQGGLIFIKQFHSRADMTNFIGTLNGLTSLLMLPVQLFLFSRIVTKIGVGNANIIFPLGTFLISGSVLIAPLSLTSGALAHFDRNTFRYSTQESSNNLLYNAVPLRVKGRSRSFIEGLILPVALLVSSLLLEIGKRLPAGWFLPVLLGIPALAYLLCALLIRKQYTQAMITLLEQEDYSSLLPSTDNLGLSVDPVALDILSKKLAGSQDDSVTLLIAEIMIEASGLPAMPFIKEKAAESSASLRAGMIDLVDSAGIKGGAAQRFYTSFLSDADAHVRLAAFTGLEHSINGENKKFLLYVSKLLLNDPDYAVRTQVLARLLNSRNPVYLQPAMDSLDGLLRNPDIRARICALDALGATRDPRYLTTITLHLNDAVDEVRLHALMALAMRSAQNLSDEIRSVLLGSAERFLKDPVERARLEMLALLDRARLPVTYGYIAGALADPIFQVREMAADILAKIGETAIPALELARIENAQNQQQQKLLIVALCRINVRRYGDLAEAQVKEELKIIYARRAQLDALRDLKALPGVLVLRAALNEQIRHTLDGLFTLLSARYGEKPVRVIKQALNTGASRTQANANEAIESLVGPQLAKLITPLLENDVPPAALDRVSTVQPMEPLVVLRNLISDSENAWLRAFTVYMLGEAIRDDKPPEPAPARNPRTRGLRQLDQLLAGAEADTDAPVSAKDFSAGKTLFFSTSEARELIAAALADPAPEVHIAAQVAARMLDEDANKPAEENRMTDSLSMIERIIFLKQVAFFQSMAFDQLKALASICEEEFLPQDTPIFKEGQAGGTLYIVVTGRVAIDREGERKGSVVRLATMEARSSFGEMNLFDNSPRSASASTIADTRVLKLQGEPLIALMRQQPDMLLELIKILNQRIREADDQIAHLSRSRPRQLDKLYDALEDSGAGVH